MSTYSLLLRGPLGRKLTITEMDGNFIHINDVANEALVVANEALLGANTGGTASVLLDPNHNLLAGVDSFFAGGSSQSYILSSNSLISGSKGSTILGGNSVTCNPGDYFYGANLGGFILGGGNNFITGGDSHTYDFNGNTYIYNNPNASIFTCGGSVIGGGSNVNYESNNASIIGGFCNTNEVSCNSSIIGAQNTCVCSSNSSAVIGGAYNCLFSSNNSVILGGIGLTLSNVNNTVLVDNLIVKGDLTDYYGNPIGGGGSASVSIVENEVAFGTGDGITSSENFKFDSTNKSLNVGSLNSLCNSIGSNIISSNVSIINSKGSTILGGNSVCNNYEPGVYFYGTYGSCVVGGRNNLITSGDSYSLNFLGNTYIYNSPNKSITSRGGSIIGGGDNSNLYSCNSSIIGGCCNTNNLSNNSSILGGVDNSNVKSCNSSIIGGYYNKISCNNSYSAIIGGANNCLFSSNNSVILGGTGLTLSSANNTVLVQNLMVKGDLTDYNGNPIVGGGIIQGTYSEILTLKNNSDLIAGQKYKITDVADTGIIIEATSDYNFSHDGVAGFLNADYQNLGNYEGTSIATQSAGLWNIDFEIPLVNYTRYDLIRWQTNEDVSSLTLNTFTRTNNSVGRITLIEADGSGGYYIYYVVLLENIDYRNDTQITQDEVTYYSIIAYSDLNQNGISTGQLITTDTGVTASITDSYQNDLYYVALDSKIDLGTSSYFYSDTYVYASIDSYNLPNTIGKVVIWNQLHWEVVDYTSFNGTSPDGNTFSYTSLNKTTTNGYIEEWDKVKYDIDTNSFGLRSDKRGNRLATNNFPWGSNNVLNVVSETSTNNICVVLSSNGGEYGGSLYGFSDSIIVGGACNTIQNTDCAAILGGFCNTICGNNYGYGYGGPGGGCNPDYSAIVGGSSNKIVASDYTPIIGGYCNRVCESNAGGIFAGCYNRLEGFSCNSTIIGGCDNRVEYYSCMSSIISGDNNIINGYSYNSTIIGGSNNYICGHTSSYAPPFVFGSCNSNILGGGDNRIINNSSYSSIIGGCWNRVCDNSDKSAIVGGGWNKIQCSQKSTVIGGTRNHICNSDRSGLMAGCCNRILNNSNLSSVIGGCCHIIDGYSCNSAILGGNRNFICGYNSNYEPGFFYGSCNSTIVGGCDNRIAYDSRLSSIIGGYCNEIYGSCGSVILGGSCLILEDVDNTVLVQNLMVKGNLTDYNGNPIGLDQGTHTEILTRKNNGTLVTGKQYLITDAADTGIIIEATTNNDFSTKALGGFLNPDYNDAGNYSTVEGFNTSRGAWNSTMEEYHINGSYNHYIRFYSDNVNVLGLTGPAHMNNSTGIITSTTDNGDGTYYVDYIVLTFNDDDFRLNISFTQDDITSYFVNYVVDLTQVAISGNIVSNLGTTAVIQSAATYSLILTDLSGSFEGSSYLFGEGNIYFTIDSVDYLRIGDVVISDGLHYLTYNWLGFNGSKPGNNIIAYYLLEKTIGNGYVEEWDPIDYDFDTDTIKLRRDKRGNVNSNLSFRWGDNNTRNNVSNFGSCNTVIGILNPNGCQIQEGSNILGGSYNTIYNSSKSSIIGGQLNNILSVGCLNCSDSAIIGGCYNSLLNGKDSAIIGGFHNAICGGADNSTILGGVCDKITNYSDNSSIIGGWYNLVNCCSNNSAIIGGSVSTLHNSCYSTIIGGAGNTASYSDYSSIIGGHNNNIYTGSCNSSVIGGLRNQVESSSCNSSIIGGCGNSMRYTRYSSINSGYNNSMLSSPGSVILGGSDNSSNSNYKSLMSGSGHTMSFGKSSVVLGGSTNRLFNNCNSAVIGGDWACMQDTCSSGIFAGAGNRIVGSMSFIYRNAIIGGHQNHICNFSCDSAIMGGCNNRIINNSNNSVILGGCDLILDNEPNKVFVPQLRIDQVNSNIGDYKLLTVDTYGNVNFRTFDSFTSSGGIVVGATESMTGFMNQIFNSSNGSVVGGGYNCVCDNSNNGSIIGGNCNIVNNCSESSSILGGSFNSITTSSIRSSVIGGNSNDINFCSSNSAIMGGLDNNIGASPYGPSIYGSCNSTILGGEYNSVFCGSCNSDVIGGCRNIITSYEGCYGSCNSTIIGGHCNKVCGSCDSTIIDGSNNRIWYSNRSNVMGGHFNTICEGDRSGILSGSGNCIGYCSNNSNILGGWHNHIGCNSCNSNIVGGHCNAIYGDFNSCTCNSVVIGGTCNKVYCSINSVIIGGYYATLDGRDNTILMNATTNFKQTVEVAISDTISASPYSVNFNNGAIKYLSTLSMDFQVDFTNIPTIANTTITYTLILNQGVTPYMITGLTINGGGLETIKWANATEPEGNVDQVDIVGLMFIYDGTGALVQVLGQMGTFA